MVTAFRRGFDLLFPNTSPAFTGRSFYVWAPGDPHLRGAYSYLATGQFTGFNGVQGQREGNLHFAGEHTSMRAQGYLEGAVASGRRAAHEVLESI